MGNLYLVSTPIGNLEDITLRAINTLFLVDLIVCEDTRKTGLLLNKFNRTLHAKLIRFDEFTEKKLTPELIDILTQGKSIALVSDAGTPLISDPGYSLVKAAKQRQIPVISIPGPTALIAALSVSGLPTDRFMFLGYPPEKQAGRLRYFQNVPKDTTIIFYCAPHKLNQTLIDMQKVFGDIQLVIARELTKIHEEVWSGKSSEAIKQTAKFKGEIVILFNNPQA